MKKLNIACLSVGNHAKKNIIPNIIGSGLFNLRGVYTRNKKDLYKYAEENSIELQVYQNESELYEDDTIDCVYISSPNAIHYDQILNCILHNKHVLVEKTAITNFEKANELISLANVRNVIIVEAFMYLHHIQFNTLKDIIISEKFGKPQFISAYFGFPHLNENDIRYNKNLGGGALFDAGAYVINLFRNLVSCQNIQISGGSLRKNENGLDIRGTALLTNGDIEGNLSWGFGLSYRNSVEVWLNDTIIKADRIFSKPTTLGTLITIEKNGSILKKIELEPDNHFANMLNDFYNKVIKCEFLSSNNEILKQLHVVNMVHQL